MESYPHYLQTEAKDCGPACIKIVSMYFGVDVPIKNIKDACQLSDTGTSLYNMEQASILIGLDCIATKLSWNELKTTVDLPCILLLYGNHYVVIPPQDLNNDIILVSDPNVIGSTKIHVEDLSQNWTSGDAEHRGYALIYGNI